MEPKDAQNSKELENKKNTLSEESIEKDVKDDTLPEALKEKGVKSNKTLKEENLESLSSESDKEKLTPEEVHKEEKSKSESVEQPEEKNQVKEKVIEDIVPEKESIDDEKKVPEKTEVEKEVSESVEKDVTTQPDAPETAADKMEKKEALTFEKPEEQKVNYNTCSEIELVNELRSIIHNNNDEVKDIKTQVEAIKSAFYKKLKESVKQQKKEYVEENGSDEEFKPEENPYENDVKELLNEYRQQRTEFNKKLEAQKEENLQLKYQVIEEIKALINTEESINKTFHEFRQLQQRWREIGLVPQSALKNLWENYHFNVENFYDYIKINKELRDLDFRKNLEAKIHLCELAEELLVEPSVIKAFNTLQKYHDQWREIGPVPREQREDLWERFKAATATINKKHQQYFQDRKDEQKKNLEAKTALCEQVEAILEKETTDHKDWNQSSKEVIELQKVWRTIGYAPQKHNNKIYECFRKACDRFFDAKREFYAENKELQKNNLQAKTDLCEQAEAMQESTDWGKTTQDYIDIQKQWKEIGPVSRKQSDAIWRRFRKACDHFFERKNDHFSNINEEYDNNLELKNQLIEEIKSYKFSDDVNENLEKLKEFQRRWAEIGFVPIKKKDDVQRLYRQAINVHYDKLNVDESKRNMLKFKNKMSTFAETTRGQSKMRMERDKFAFKLKNLESDLVLLENNVGFFANSKNAESLIEDVNKKIEQTKVNIEQLKKKIRLIDEMEE